MDKTRFISRFPIALETLRVCWQLDTDFNCGSCPKCMETMVYLHVAGALEKCETLPHAIDPSLVESLVRSGNENQRLRLASRAAGLGGSEADIALREAIERGLR